MVSAWEQKEQKFSWKIMIKLYVVWGMNQAHSFWLWTQESSNERTRKVSNHNHIKADFLFCVKYWHIGTFKYIFILTTGKLSSKNKISKNTCAKILAWVFLNRYKFIILIAWLLYWKRSNFIYSNAFLLFSIFGIFQCHPSIIIIKLAPKPHNSIRCDHVTMNNPMLL